MAAKTPTGPGHVFYGGQAVLEGVMIRGPEHIGIAVRHPRGHIVTHSERLSALYTGQARRIPFLRGIIVLAETLALGMRALTFSSQIAMEAENEDAEPAEFPQSIFWGAIALSLLFVVGFFFAGPILLAHTLEFWDAPRWTIVGAEAVLRLLAFIGYIVAIGFVPDIRRVFQYHGAEHMTIHAYESGRPLETAAIREFPKEHNRCGTSFLLIVVLVAMVVFFTFDVTVDEGLFVRVASRILLIPFVAAIAYEILRLGGRYEGTLPIRILFAPNIALQYLTTKVPDDTQIEVAIVSFQVTLAHADGMTKDHMERVESLEAAPPIG